VATKTPALLRKTVSILTTATLELTDIGVQRAIFISSGIMAQNPKFTFGPLGSPIQFNTTAGLFINFDEEFDSLKIENVGAGTAAGDIVFSGCSGFYMTNI